MMAAEHQQEYVPEPAEEPSATMRHAAAKMRLWPTGNFLGSVANLLDEIARQYDAPPCDCPNGVCNGCETRQDFNDALWVAEAYLRDGD